MTHVVRPVFPSRPLFVFFSSPSVSFSLFDIYPDTPAFTVSFLLELHPSPPGMSWPFLSIVCAVIVGSDGSDYC